MSDYPQAVAGLLALVAGVSFGVGNQVAAGSALALFGVFYAAKALAGKEK